MTWSDVPKAVKMLADKWGIKPVPAGEHHSVILKSTNV